MLGESYGQRSLAGYSRWGRKELDTTERLTEAPGSVLGSEHPGESGWQSPCPPGAHLLLECRLSEQTGQSGGEARLAPLDCSHSPNTPGSFPLTCAFSSWVFCLMCCFPFLTLATSCHPSRIIPTVSSPLRFSLNTCTPTLGASCSLLVPSTLLLASVIAPLCGLVIYSPICLLCQIDLLKGRTYILFNFVDSGPGTQALERCVWNVMRC